MTRYVVGTICFGVVELAWIVAACLRFHQRGYELGHKEGYQEGFEAGRMRADDWWMNLEYETLQARAQIRREEGLNHA